MPAVHVMTNPVLLLAFQYTGPESEAEIEAGTELVVTFVDAPEGRQPFGYINDLRELSSDTPLQLGEWFIYTPGVSTQVLRMMPWKFEAEYVPFPE